MMKRSRLTAVALAAACANGAMAMDVAGFEFNGYSRGGPVFNHSDGIKGRFGPGGELQKFRLGNEGDNGIEINLARTL
jgi:maltoporin